MLQFLPRICEGDKAERAGTEISGHNLGMRNKLDERHYKETTILIYCCVFLSSIHRVAHQGYPGRIVESLK